MMTNLVCEGKWKGGDKEAKPKEDQREKGLAKLNWVFYWGILVNITKIFHLSLLFLVDFPFQPQGICHKMADFWELCEHCVGKAGNPSMSMRKKST